MLKLYSKGIILTFIQFSKGIWGRYLINTIHTFNSEVVTTCAAICILSSVISCEPCKQMAKMVKMLSNFFNNLCKFLDLRFAKDVCIKCEAIALDLMNFVVTLYVLPSQSLPSYYSVFSRHLSVFLEVFKSTEYRSDLNPLNNKTWSYFEGKGVSEKLSIKAKQNCICATRLKQRHKQIHGHCSLWSHKFDSFSLCSAVFLRCVHLGSMTMFPFYSEAFNLTVITYFNVWIPLLQVLRLRS